MGDFSAIIKAILDTSDIMKQIEELGQKSIELDVKISKNSMDKQISSFKKSFESSTSKQMNMLSNQVDKITEKQIKTILTKNDNKDYKRMLSDIEKKRSSITEKYNKGFTGADVSINNAIKSLSEIEKTGNMEAKIKASETFANNIRKATNEIKIFNNESTNSLKIQNQANTIKNNINSKKYESEISDVKFKYDTYKTKGYKDINNINSNFSKLEKLQGKMSSTNDTRELISLQNKYNSVLEETKNKLKIINNEGKKTTTIASNLDIKTFENKLFNFEKANPKALKQFGEEYKKIINDYNNAKNISGGNFSTKELGNFNTKLRSLENAAKSAGVAGNTLFGNFKKGFQTLSTYVTPVVALGKAVQVFKEMSQNVQNVDKAMVGLKRVTNLTEDEYKTLYTGIMQSSKQYSAELDEFINATSGWVRLGFDPDTAKGLAEVSTMYQHVTDLDESTAVENLVTAYKGYQDKLTEAYGNDATKAMEHISDVYDKLGNEMPVTAAQVAEGMNHVASIMAESGATFEEAASMITGGGAVTQDFAGFGNALKVSTLRIKGMKGKLEELGEEVDDNVQSVSKVQTHILNLTKGKVNIFDNDGNYKNITQIFREISNVYDKLSQPNQQELLETIAGKTRANQIQAMITHWNDVELAIKKTGDAAGTARKEEEEWQKGYEGKSRKFTAVWQNFSNTFLDIGKLKGYLTLTTSLLEIVTKLVEKIGTIPTIIGGITLFKSIGKTSRVGSDFSILGNIPLLGNTFTSLKNKSKESKSNINVDSSNIIDFNKRTKPTSSQTSNYTRSIKDSTKELNVNSTAIESNTSKIHGQKTALEGVEKASIGARIASVALNTALSVGISFAVSFLIEKLTAYTERAKKLSEEVNTIMSQREDKITKASDNKAKFNELKPELEKLSQGVSSTGENISLTSDEFERYNSIVSEIKDMSPELVKSYEHQGKTIDVLKGNVSELADEYEKAEKNARKFSEKQQRKIFEDYSNKIDKKSFLTDETSNTERLDFLKSFKKDIQNTKNVTEVLSKRKYSEHDASTYLQKMLGKDYNKELAYEDGEEWQEYINNNKDNILKKTDSAIKSMNKKATKDFETAREILLQSLNESKEYNNIESEKFKTLISSVFKNMDASTYLDLSSNDKKLTAKSLQTNPEYAKKYIDNLIKDFSDINLPARTQSIIENLMIGMKGSNPVEVQKKIQENIEKLKKYFKETGYSELLNTDVLDSVFNTEQIEERANKYHNTLITSYKELNDGFKYNLGGLFEELSIDDTNELDTWLNICKTVDTVTEAVARYKKEILTLENIRNKSEENQDDTNTLLSGYSNIKELINNQGNGSSIKLGDFKNADFAEYKNAVEYNNGAFQLNQEKANAILNKKIDAQLVENNKEKSNAQLKYLDNLHEIQIAEAQLADAQIRNDVNSKAQIESHIESLKDENNELNGIITSYDLMNVSIKETTSAYQNFVDAQKAKESGEQYDESLKAFNKINDTLNSKKSDSYKRIGNADYKAALEFVLPEKINSNDQKAINKYLKSMKDVFKIGTGGKFESLDYEGFFKKAQKNGLLKFNNISKEYELVGKKSIESFAKGMNMSVPLIEAIFGELKEFGIEFELESKKSFNSSAIDAANAAEKLRGKSIGNGKKIDAITNVDNIEDKNEAVKTLDNTITEMKQIQLRFGVNSEEYSQAEAILNHCKEQKDLIDKPIIMSVNTENLEQNVSESITLLQKFYNEQSKIESLSKDKKRNKKELTSLEKKHEDTTKSLSSSKYSDTMNKLGIDTSSTKNVENTLKTVNAEGLVKIGVNTEDIDGWYKQTLEKGATVKWENDTKNVEDFETGKHIAEGIVSFLEEHPLVTKFETSTHEGEGTITFSADGKKVDNYAYKPPNGTGIIEYDVLKKKVDSYINNPGQGKSFIDFLATHGKVDEYKNSNPTGKGTIEFKPNTQPLEDRMKNFQNISIPVTMKIKEKKIGGNILTDSGNSSKEGKGKADGTAHANGNWGTKKTEKALVGEVGQEILVNPRTGKWQTIGDNGAEFIDIPKDSIIFNHEQTEEILEHGHINSRGTSYVSGNAYVSKTKVSGLSGASSSLLSALTKSQKEKAKSKKKDKSTSKKPSTSKKSSKNSKSNSKSKSTDKSKSTSKSKSTNNTKDTVLDAIKKWISSLFDWIEIKINTQSKKIDRNISKAQAYQNVGNYNAASNQYTSAIRTTSYLADVEQTAGQKYSSKANSILNKAVGKGIINKDFANGIKKKVADGSIRISEYGEKVRTVIEEYQNWYNKAQDAKNAVDDLHDGIKTYIDDLKSLRDAQRDAKLNDINTYTEIGTSGVAHTAGFQNSQINLKNRQLAEQNKAYNTETNALISDNNKLGSIAKSNINKESKTKNKQYKNALAAAKKAIDSKQKVSNSILNTIKKHSIKVYNNIYAYNLSLDNIELSRLEEAAVFATNSSQYFQNIAEQYNNKDNVTNAQIDLLRSRADNATSSATKNKYLNDMVGKYDQLIKDDDAEIKQYQNAVNTHTNNITKKTATTSLLKKQSASARKNVNDFVARIRNAVKNKKIISSADVSKAAEYYKKGLITKTFYNSIVDYNNALESLKTAKDQREIDFQSAVSNKAEIGSQKIDNINQDYQNKLDENAAKRQELETAQNLKKTRGLDLIASDYKNLINNSKEEQKILIEQRNAINNQISKNIKEGLWTKSSQEYINATNQLKELNNSINECTIAQEEWNNEILNLPLANLEKALEKLDAIKSYIDSTLSYKELKGLTLTYSDYEKDLNNLYNQRNNILNQVVEKQEGLNKARNSSNGVYGGKDILTWEEEYYKALTDRNNIQKDILQTEIDQYNLYFDNIEKEIDYLEDVNSLAESYKDLMLEKGEYLSEDYYTSMMDRNEDIATNYKTELEKALYSMDHAKRNHEGVFEGKSYQEWEQEVNKYQISINKTLEENEKFKKSLRDDVYWRNFEKAHKKAEAYQDVLENLNSLISDDMYFDKDGKITEYGTAQIANFVSQYENAKIQIQNYKNDLENLNKLNSEGYYTQDEYNDKFEELKNNLLSSAQSMKTLTNSIIDMYKQTNQEELNSLFKLIDSRAKAYDLKKSYYEYDKTLKNKTKEVQVLQAEIAALEGINDIASRAKKATLLEQLHDAQEDLDDTIQEHMFEISQESLDKLKTSLQEAFDENWDNINLNLDEITNLMVTANELTKNSTEAITTTMNKLLSYYGIDSDTNMSLGLKTYATGTRYVPHGMNALTNEAGNEILVTKKGLITPLNQGDGVIPSYLTNKLYDLAINGISGSNINIPKIMVQDQKSSITEINQHYDSLINIEGSADAVTVEELKSLSKDIIEKSYEYTSQKIYKGYIHSGGKRNV